jgi:hypothetical protein
MVKRLMARLSAGREQEAGTSRSTAGTVRGQIGRHAADRTRGGLLGVEVHAQGRGLRQIPIQVLN